MLFRSRGGEEERRRGGEEERRRGGEECPAYSHRVNTPVLLICSNPRFGLTILHERVLEGKRKSEVFEEILAVQLVGMVGCAAVRTSQEADRHISLLRGLG